MPNILSKVVSLIILVLLGVVVPVYYQYKHIDNLVYNQVHIITNDFQREVRHHGYVSKELYEEFMRKLAETGRDFEVNMLHREIKYYPLDPDHLSYRADKPYSVEYFEYDQRSILKTIYTDQRDYLMKIGDDFRVIVKEKDSLTGSNILAKFLWNRQSLNTGIHAIYGGMVENEIY